MSDKIICYATYNDLTNAYMVKNILEENEIFSFIENENITTANPLLSNAVGGIRLMVNENDVERITSILNENNPIEIGDEESIEEESEVTDETTDDILCPKCTSSNTWKETIGFIFSKTKYHCYDCGNEW